MAPDTILYKWKEQYGIPQMQMQKGAVEFPLEKIMNNGTCPDTKYKEGKKDNRLKVCNSKFKNNKTVSWVHNSDI